MKQLVVLSGKGGTGKTSVTAALAHLAAADGSHVRAILADADVDAANLELVVAPNQFAAHEFMGGQVAIIDSELCEGCNICVDVCRFDALDGETLPPTVDSIACDGCAACVYQCPTEAIHMDTQKINDSVLPSGPLP